MKMYESDFGDVMTEEQAREEARNNMDWYDYEEYMREHVAFSHIYDKLCHLPGFFEAFEDELMAAEEQFFRDNYHETDIEEEDA